MTSGVRLAGPMVQTILARRNGLAKGCFFRERAEEGASDIVALVISRPARRVWCFLGASYFDRMTKPRAGTLTVGPLTEPPLTWSVIAIAGRPETLLAESARLTAT